MKGYMYILECSDGSYYTGSTTDLERRLAQHQNGEGANHTKKRLPVKLVYVEEYSRIDEAFYREKQVQGWSRKKKEALIKGMPEKLHELAKCMNESSYLNNNGGFDSAQPHENNYSAQSPKNNSSAETPDKNRSTQTPDKSSSAQPTSNERCLSEAERCLSEAERCLSEAERCLSEAERCLSEAERCLSEAERCLSEAERCLSEAEGSVYNNNIFKKLGI